MTRTSRKVAIVARGGTYRLAPYDDPEWDIWGLPWCDYPRVDRVFEIHSEEFFDDLPDDSWFKAHRWLTRFEARCPNTEVWCDPTRMRRFRNAVEYPLGAVQKALPVALLENSHCYMIALAIMERRPEIGLYGVHMFAGPEADTARAAILFLLGYAMGIGIKVSVAHGSPLLMSNFVAGRYGARGGPKSIRPRFIASAGVQWSDQT